MTPKPTFDLQVVTFCWYISVLKLWVKRAERCFVKRILSILYYSKFQIPKMFRRFSSNKTKLIFMHLWVMGINRPNARSLSWQIIWKCPPRNQRLHTFSLIPPSGCIQQDAVGVIIIKLLVSSIANVEGVTSHHNGHVHSDWLCYLICRS